MFTSSTTTVTPADVGELFVEPPSIGLSVELLNRDHSRDVLRRRAARVRGDRCCDVTATGWNGCANGYFRVHGRADDAMNLGGIKVSSAEIERAVGTCDGAHEAAAVAVAPPGGGPSRLIVFMSPQ